MRTQQRELHLPPIMETVLSCLLLQRGQPMGVWGGVAVTTPILIRLSACHTGTG